MRMIMREAALRMVTDAFLKEAREISLGRLTHLAVLAVETLWPIFEECHVYVSIMEDRRKEANKRADAAENREKEAVAKAADLKARLISACPPGSDLARLLLPPPLLIRGQGE